MTRIMETEPTVSSISCREPVSNAIRNAIWSRVSAISIKPMTTSVVAGTRERFAYYGSLNGNRSNLGLQPPTPAIIHDAENGFGGFGTLIFNVDPKDQFRFVISSRRDYYQIPNSDGQINEIYGQPGVIYLTPYPPGTFFQMDGEQEADTFINFSWVRTLSPDFLLTVSPFFHYNSANYSSNPNDLPTATTDDRASTYAGGQVTLERDDRPELDERAGSMVSTSMTTSCSASCSMTQAPQISRTVRSSTEAWRKFWFEDKFKATSWLTLSGGVRQSHFSGTISENATSPRAGISVRIPKTNVVIPRVLRGLLPGPSVAYFLGACAGERGQADKVIASGP